ncbi:SemiSWEET family sugar transporter [Prochlorococcus marinus]|uniref:SemiSWEET family sugar transporter n=1 Tax=Prochlorococcus marinus TaxID=1219 RepID=UPI0039AF91E0
MSQFNYIDLFGFSAAFLTTIAFIPQLYKTWQTKSADDVSLVMLILFITGLFCWIIYGLKINSIPILVANIITFIFNFSILILKLTYRNNNQ